MHGNVIEWCLDWHGPYDGAEQTDPVGRVEGYANIARGWCFHRPERARDPLKYWQSSNRSGFLPEDANRLTGFRVVQAEPPPTSPLPMTLEPYQKDVKQTAAPMDGPDASKPCLMNWTAAGKNPINLHRCLRPSVRASQSLRCRVRLSERRRADGLVHLHRTSRAANWLKRAAGCASGPTNGSRRRCSSMCRM